MPWNPLSPGATSQQDNTEAGSLPGLGGAALTANIAPSSARTTSGNTSAITTGGAATLNLLWDVTAVSGTTPTLTLEVQWSHDGTTWFVSSASDSTATINAAQKAVKPFAVKAPYYRVNWFIAGTTPSFTFALHAYLQD